MAQQISVNGEPLVRDGHEEELHEHSEKYPSLHATQNVSDSHIHRDHMDNNVSIHSDTTSPTPSIVVSASPNDATLNKQISTRQQPTQPQKPHLIDTNVLHQNEIALEMLKPEKPVTTASTLTFTNTSWDDDNVVQKRVNPWKKFYSVCCTTAKDAERQYRVWHGKQHFFFCGRMMIGPDVQKLLLSLFLMLLPTTWYFSTCFPFYIIEFPFYIPLTVGLLVPCCLAIPLLSLFLVATSDPGIMPPKHGHPIAAQDLLEKKEHMEPKQLGTAVPLYQTISIQGKVTKFKFCYTCKMYRPPRCSHCPACNICIEHFDHHCPYIGTCIGKRNYRTFLTFIYSTWLLIALGYLMAFAQIGLAIYMAIYRYQQDYHVAFLVTRLVCYLIGPLALSVYLILPGLFLTSLSLFHGMLIFRNMSTYEYIKKNRGAPNYGLFKNAAVVLCSKYPRKKVGFRNALQSLYPVPMNADDADLVQHVHENPPHDV